MRPPLVGIGTFNHLKDAAAVGEAVRLAIAAGYRHLDFAPVHENQKECGLAITAALAAPGADVTREQLYVVSKLWCSDAAPEDVADACRKTLAELGLDYLDNYTMHWPVQMTKDSGIQYLNICIAETYAAMEALVDAGLVRSLGVANFDVRMLGELMQDCRIAPITNQIELHPFLSQSELTAFCATVDVHVVSYTPLGSMNVRGVDDPDLYGDSLVKRIAIELGRTPGQVLQRWAVQRGASVIDDALSPDHIVESRDVLDWAMSASQMERLDSLDIGHRFIQVTFFFFFFFFFTTSIWAPLAFSLFIFAQIVTLIYPYSLLHV
ncbi:NADP-dependent oxidoreductase domain-containing protein [Pavlovales sp. CCMP2436]|nr:NADP-dependent oxidoreductase domain-containing protein [Pavlovales sp. CCMP2436]